MTNQFDSFALKLKHRQADLITSQLSQFEKGTSTLVTNPHCSSILNRHAPQDMNSARL